MGREKGCHGRAGNGDDQVQQEKQRKKSGRSGRSYEGSVEKAGGGARCSEREGRQDRWHHLVSDDSGTSHLGAKSSMQGAGRKRGGRRQRQKTEHSFLKFEKKEELGL